MRLFSLFNQNRKTIMNIFKKEDFEGFDLYDIECEQVAERCNELIKQNGQTWYGRNENDDGHLTHPKHYGSDKAAKTCYPEATHKSIMLFPEPLEAEAVECDHIINDFKVVNTDEELEVLIGGQLEFRSSEHNPDIKFCPKCGKALS